jgi:hypothetical protein
MRAKTRGIRVVRGYPIWQIEQIRKKGFFRLPEFLDLNPSFYSANDSTNRQNDNIPQAMKLGSFYSRVFHLRKNAFKVSQVVFFHPLASSFFDLFYHLPIISFLRMSLFRCDCPADGPQTIDRTGLTLYTYLGVHNYILTALIRKST